MTVEQIEEVLPDIFCVPIPLSGNPLKELNSYFIRGRGDERSLIIDTGFRTKECMDAILDGIRLLNINLNVTDILLTHMHADHSGNASDIICPGCKIYISSLDKKYLTGNLNLGNEGLHINRSKRLARNGVSQELIEKMFNSAPSRLLAADKSFTGYTCLEEGDEVQAGAYTLKAILTPGHTPGHMCFDILGTGAMILGDHVLFDITPNITDWMGVDDSLGDYLASIDKIDKYDVLLPLPGHRKRGIMHERTARLKAHHYKRLDECYSVIKNTDHAMLYEIAGNMTWKIRTESWNTFPDAQRWFALGECLSHIDHLIRTGRAVSHEDKDFIWYEAL